MDGGRNVRLEVTETATSSDWEVQWMSAAGSGYMVEVSDSSRLVLEGGAALTTGPGGSRGSTLHLFEHTASSTKTATVWVEAGSELEMENTVVSGPFSQALRIEGDVVANNSAFGGSTNYTYGSGSALIAVEGSSSTGEFTSCEIRTDRTTQGSNQWPTWVALNNTGFTTGGDHPDALVRLKQGDLLLRRSRDPVSTGIGTCAGAVKREAQQINGGEFVAVLIDGGDGTVSENNIYDTNTVSSVGIHFKNGEGTASRNYLENSGGFLSGIRIDESSSGSRILRLENNYILDASRGIQVSSLVDGLVTIQHNTIEDPGFAGLWFNDDHAITVEGNAIVDLVAVGAFWDASIGGTPSMTFAANGFALASVAGSEYSPSSAATAFSSSNDSYGVTAAGINDDACTYIGADDLDTTSVLADPIATSSSPPSVDLVGNTRPVPASSNEDQGSLEAP